MLHSNAIQLEWGGLKGKRQAFAAGIDGDSLPGISDYDDGMWHPDTGAVIPIATPIAPLVSSIGSSALVSPTTAPTLQTAVMTTPPDTRPPSSTSTDTTEASATRTLSGLPHQTQDVDPQQGSDNDSGFKVAYLTPVFILIGVFLICSLGGRLWGKVWHARKREARRRDRQARRTASGTGTSHLHSWDEQPLSLHDKDSALDVDVDDFEEDEKYPGPFHILSQRILGDNSRVAPPTSRARTGKYESEVHSNSWWLVQLRKMMSKQEPSEDGGRYTVGNLPLNHVASRSRLRQMRGDIESAAEAEPSLFAFRDVLTAEKQVEPFWTKWKGYLTGRFKSEETDSIKSRTCDERAEAARLWGQPPVLRQSPSSIGIFHGDSIRGGITALAQPEFGSAAPGSLFSRRPSTMSASNLRSRSRGHYKPLPEIVDEPTPTSPSWGQFVQMKDAISQGLTEAWQEETGRSPMRGNLFVGEANDRPAAKDSRQEQHGFNPNAVINIERNPSQARSETYSVTAGTTISSLPPPTPQDALQGTKKNLGRSRSQQRPGTTYMYDQQLPDQESYRKTPSPPMETPRKWRPAAASSKGSFREDSNALTPPARVARSATTSSKSDKLLIRVRTQRRSVTEYMESVKPLDFRRQDEPGPLPSPEGEATSYVRATPTRTEADPSTTAAGTMNAASGLRAAKRSAADLKQENASRAISRSKTVGRAKSSRQKGTTRAGEGVSCGAVVEAEPSRGPLSAEELTELLNTPGLSPEVYEANASALADLLDLYGDREDYPDTPAPFEANVADEPQLSSGGASSDDDESLATDEEIMAEPSYASVRKSRSTRTSSTVSVVDEKDDMTIKSTFYTPLPGMDDDGHFVAPAYMQIDEPDSMDHVFSVLSKYVGIPDGVKTPEAPVRSLASRHGAIPAGSKPLPPPLPITPEKVSDSGEETPTSRKKTWMKDENGRWYRADGEGPCGGLEEHEPRFGAPSTPVQKRPAKDYASPSLGNRGTSIQDRSRVAAALPARTISPPPLPTPPAAVQASLPSSLVVASPNSIDRIASPPPQNRHDLFFASPASPTSVVTRPRSSSNARSRDAAAPTRRGHVVCRSEGTGNSMLTSTTETVMPSFGSVVSTAPHRANSKTRNWIREQTVSPLSSPAIAGNAACSGENGGQAQGSPQRRAAIVRKRSSPTMHRHPPRKYKAALSGGARSPFAPNAALGQAESERAEQSEGSIYSASPTASALSSGLAYEQAQTARSPAKLQQSYTVNLHAANQLVEVGHASRTDGENGHLMGAQTTTASTGEPPRHCILNTDEKERKRHGAMARVQSIVKKGYDRQGSSSLGSWEPE